MGTSHSPAALTNKLQHLEREYRDLPLSLVKESALLTKTAILSFTRPASGGDLRLSGVGKKGAKIGVRYNVIGSGTESAALVFATGPFHLIERDTQAGPRPHKRRRGRGKKRFIGPIVGAWHPGTKGKHPFEHGIEAARQPTKVLFQAKNNLVLHRIF